MPKPFNTERYQVHVLSSDNINFAEIDDLKGVSFLDEQFSHSDLPAKFGDPNLLRGELGNMRTTTPNKSPRSQPLVEQGLLDTSVEPQDQQTPNYNRDNLPTPASLSNVSIFINLHCVRDFQFRFHLKNVFKNTVF